MRIIHTTDPKPTDSLGLLSIYNGFDVLTLFEIHEGLQAEMRPDHHRVYEFEMDLQAPLLQMAFAGIPVDTNKRAEMVRRIQAEKAHIEGYMHQLCEAIGYYDYYRSIACARYQSQSEAATLPRSWAEWLATPLTDRRQWKQSAGEAATKTFQKWLKELDQPFNPNSGPQKLRLFYHFLGIDTNEETIKRFPEFPPPWGRTKGLKEFRTRSTNGEYTPGVDRDTLEKLLLRADNDPSLAAYWAQPFLNLCLYHADLAKTLQFLNCKLDQGWFYSSFGCVTETGRLSSKKSNYDSRGWNSQNVSPPLRVIFTSPLGQKSATPDYEQIESRMVAARCYLQFGALAYLAATECLTADHEVLTPTGWVPISTMPEQIATWDPQGKVQFQKPFQWVEKPAEQTYEINTKAFSIRATYNHKVPYYGGKYKTSFRTTTMCQAFSQSNCTTPTSGKWLEGEIFGANAYQLLAAYQADGTINSSNRIEFSFSKQRKIDRLSKLLTQEAIPYRVNVFPPYGNQTKPTTRFYINPIDWPVELHKEAGPYLLRLEQHTLDAYVAEHEFWDGYRENKKGYRLTAKSLNHLEWIATLAHLTGRIASSPIPDKMSWRMNIQDRDRTAIGTQAGWRMVHNESSTVYCPTVSSGFFLYRRKGHIAVSGNCGDLHSLACSMVWEELPWPEDFTVDWTIKHGPFPKDMVKAAKSLAKVEAYRGKSRRDLSKTLGHGSNYFGKAPNMAKQSHIDLGLVQHYQDVYFAVFPEVRMWHNWIIEQVQVRGEYTTIFGRPRKFFGRSSDDATIRQAIAHDGQSPAADYTNRGMLRIHKASLDGSLPVELFLQKHDECGVRYREEDEQLVTREMLRLMEEHFTLTSPTGLTRDWYVPAEMLVGWNLGHANDANPDGLIEFFGADDRVRQHNPWQSNLLEMTQ